MGGIEAGLASLQKCHRSDRFKIITLRCLCVSCLPFGPWGCCRDPQINSAPLLLAFSLFKACWEAPLLMGVRVALSFVPWGLPGSPAQRRWSVSLYQRYSCKDGPWCHGFAFWLQPIETVTFGKSLSLSEPISIFLEWVSIARLQLAGCYMQ